MLDLGVIVLCPYYNGNTRFTINCIKSELNCPYVTMVSDKIHEEDIEEIREYSPVFRSNSITNMINDGSKRLITDWKMTIMSGNHISYSLIKKYQKFIKSNKDILYSVINRRFRFYESSFNGFLFHKDALDKVGKIPNYKLDESRILWGSEALHKGYNLKAIVGGKF